VSVSINENLFIGGQSGASSLVSESYDYIIASYPNATTETYVYKVGGSNGTVVATVTVEYTTSEKRYISTYTRT
jgi:hypothetical protein